MASFKLTSLGGVPRNEQVEISVDLTPEQRSLITGVTGKSITKLELTASELKMILRPNLAMQKSGWDDGSPW